MSKQHAELLHQAFYGKAWHGASLMENLEGVDVRTAAAKPIAGAHSIWELVLHLAAWNREFAKLLRGGEATVELNTDSDWPPVRDTSESAWKQAMSELKASEEDLRQAMEAIPESDLSKTMPGREYKIAFAMHGLPHHLTYHGGQIALLKKAASK